VELADLARKDFTYTPRGLTLDGPLPPGIHHLEVRRRIGRGDAAYRSAGESVMTFGAQRGCALRPQATATRAAVGVDLLSRLAVVPVPCRVVWALEGPERTGFGYGTLEGHPESGEEGFLVEREGDDVYAVIRAYSVAVHPAARVGGPLTRRLQWLAALGYIAAIRRSTT
jgi:uncharacterized protein (UPF0548 family)